MILIPNSGEYPITRHLPKTGQIFSYAANDDGIHERGWWRGRPTAGVPPNINKNRWLQGTIGGDAVVVDRATGIMWPTNCTAAGGNGGAAIATWLLAIAWAEALNFAGFTDWHLPNINELHSIVNFGAVPAWYQPPFTNVINNYYWSETTYPVNVAFAMCMRFQFVVGGAFNKGAPGVPVYALAMREAAI